MTRLGIVSVATNRYLDYWIELVESAESRILSEQVTFHVFTNFEPASVHEKLDVKFHKVVIHKIPALVWPEATILRFELIGKFQNLLKHRYLMHLDADMIIREDFLLSFKPDTWANGIALVSHPGFYRPNGSALLKFYLSNPYKFLIDVRMKLILGGLGAWSNDAKSKAFVKRKYRKFYVCGATWMGHRDEFLRMVHTLADAVRTDLKNEVMAIWHDESHLNNWAALNTYTLLEPNLCFAPGYAQLSKLQNIIEAVEKSYEKA